MTYQLKTRPPTGRVPWPLILIEGGEKAGKSWACAELSASDKVGRTYWVDLGEGAADEYGAVPGARYEVVEHNGTMGQLISIAAAVKAEAQRAADAGEPPVVLVIDSMTAEWDLLKGMADAKARARRQRQLARKGKELDPDAEISISMDLWNEINSKHRQLMNILMTTPGIVVMTARGKEVAALDSTGRPVEGSREYKVEGQKSLAFDAAVWVRVGLDHDPVIIGARSVHSGIRPGVNRPLRVLHERPLENIIFDVLRCGEAPGVRHLVPLSVEDLSPQAAAMVAAIEDADTLDVLRTWWERIAPAVEAGDITAAEGEHLTAAIKTRKAALETAQPAPPAAPAPALQQQHRRMHALWREHGLGGDEHRADRLKRTAEILGLPALESSRDLTQEQASTVIAALADAS